MPSYGYEAIEDRQDRVVYLFVFDADTIVQLCTFDIPSVIDSIEALRSGEDPRDWDCYWPGMEEGVTKQQVYDLCDLSGSRYGRRYVMIANENEIFSERMSEVGRYLFEIEEDEA